MISRFFIDRPVFAWVIALVIMLAGGLSILKLPINQYPSIAPPAVAIQVSYPGASAQTVQDTVVQVIEQQLNGIDGLRYVSSSSNSDGSMEIIVTFEQGVNPDIAQVHEPVDRSQQVICRHMILEAEAVKQRLLHHRSLAHHQHNSQLQLR